jgi:uncharacterized protein (DUF2237 family)
MSSQIIIQIQPSIKPTSCCTCQLLFWSITGYYRSGFVITILILDVGPAYCFVPKWPVNFWIFSHFGLAILSRLPEFTTFAGLKPGDYWIVSVLRWVESTELLILRRKMKLGGLSRSLLKQIDIETLRYALWRLRYPLYGNYCCLG